MTEKEYSVVGMMSGTSLDGIDLVLCKFWKENLQWHFKLRDAETFSYDVDWKDKLINAAYLNSLDFVTLHHSYGVYIGSKVKDFLAGNTGNIDLVASHGHTIFHQPERGITFQLGEGSAIAAQCNLTTVSDFRTFDVSLGGQGAPLVPVGDELLFNNYLYCLNLGGFANISTKRNGIRIAGDICPVNIVVNNLAQRKGFEFDRDGKIGGLGTVHEPLVEELNKLDFYSQTGPKSLGREWVESVYMPVLDKYNIPLENLIRTVYEHIAIQIAAYINTGSPGEVLVTGGGAFNTFLLERIKKLSKSGIFVPDEQLVKFKEAVIFALLGLLRFRNELNCLASVTGARYDTSSGIVHLR